MAPTGASLAHNTNEPLHIVRHGNGPHPVASAMGKRHIAIRAATAIDNVAIYRLLLRYFEELPKEIPYPRPVETPTVAWILGLIARQGVVVLETEGRIIGSAALEVDRFAWNPMTEHLHGHWLYVAPEFRKGGAGAKLIETVKDVARRNGKNVMVGAIWGYEPELMDRMFAMKGFVRVGSAYLWSPTFEKKEENSDVPR